MPLAAGHRGRLHAEDKHRTKINPNDNKGREVSRNANYCDYDIQLSAKCTMCTGENKQAGTGRGQAYSRANTGEHPKSNFGTDTAIQAHAPPAPGINRLIVKGCTQSECCSGRRLRPHTNCKNSRFSSYMHESMTTTRSINQHKDTAQCELQATTTRETEVL